MKDGLFLLVKQGEMSIKNKEKEKKIELIENIKFRNLQRDIEKISRCKLN